jgi:hypothetical protein
LGLFGPWGHGKSSALNLLSDELGRWQGTGEGAKAALVIRFNPWLYSTPEALLLSFFGTLAKETGNSPLLTTGQKKALGQALQGIGDFMTLPAVATGHIWAAGTGKALGVAAKRLLDSGEVRYEKAKARAAKILEEVAASQHRTRVVVLVDDLDRAQATEIRAMLRVVRLIADLPNISYVLAMDERRVREAIAPMNDPEFGAAFLDKIIQVPVSMPRLTEEKIAQLTKEGIEEVFKEAGYANPEIFSRWSWSSDALPYDRTVGTRVRTLRDRARLLNDLRFQLLTTERRLVLEPKDALLITLLHTFFPDAYQRVRRNKQFFTGGRSQAELTVHFVKGSDEARKLRERSLSRVLGLEVGDPSHRYERWTAEPADDLVIQEIVRRLFPRAFNGAEPSEVEAGELRRGNRIESPERFDRYFHIDPPSTEIADEFMEAVVDRLVEVVCSDGHPLDAGIAEAEEFARSDPGQLDSFIEKLGDRLPYLADQLLERDSSGVVIARLARTIVSSEANLGAEAVTALISHLAQYVARREYRSGSPQGSLAILRAYVERLQDVRLAVTTVGEVFRSGGGLIASGQQLTELAEVIDSRMTAHVLNTEDPFGQPSDPTFTGVVYGWMAALRELGRDEAPVRHVTEAMTAKYPARIPMLLKRVAPNTSSGPRLDPENAPVKAVERIARLHDADLLADRAEHALVAGEIDREHEAIIREFLDLHAAAGAIKSGQTTESGLDSNIPRDAG